MNGYSDRSREQLRSCHEDLRTLFTEVLPYWDHTILEGHRSKADQNAAFDNKRSKVQWPDSKHNRIPSMAVDVAPYPIDWDDHIRFAAFAGYVLATADRLYREGRMRHKVRWGGDWDRDGHNKDQTFNDFPHFELVHP